MAIMGLVRPHAKHGLIISGIYLTWYVKWCIIMKKFDTFLLVVTFAIVVYAVLFVDQRRIHDVVASLVDKPKVENNEEVVLTKELPSYTIQPVKGN